jgi:hypothetical protein
MTTGGANNPRMVTFGNDWVPLKMAIVYARQKAMGSLCKLESFFGKKLRTNVNNPPIIEDCSLSNGKLEGSDSVRFLLF